SAGSTRAPRRRSTKSWRGGCSGSGTTQESALTVVDQNGLEGCGDRQDGRTAAVRCDSTTAGDCVRERSSSAARRTDGPADEVAAGKPTSNDRRLPVYIPESPPH